MMAMSAVWTLMVLSSLIYGKVSGNLGIVSSAAAEGAQAAVELCISMAGVLCLWTGVMEVMRRCGILDAIRKGLYPLLSRLFPSARKDGKTMELIAANVSANLLGLGNAATPLGIQAAERMAQESKGKATDDLCRFVVCNTASIQLIPTTVAAVRSGAGCQTPFDILPAVWVTSLAAITVGLVASAVLSKLWGD
jgi:spore maturation protein A